MNWIAELGIILFTFNALSGAWVAIVLGAIYLLWKFLRFSDNYRLEQKKIEIIMGWVNTNGSKRNKK